MSTNSCLKKRTGEARSQLSDKYEKTAEKRKQEQKLVKRGKKKKADNLADFGLNKTENSKKNFFNPKKCFFFLFSHKGTLHPKSNNKQKIKKKLKTMPEKLGTVNAHTLPKKCLL